MLSAKRDVISGAALAIFSALLYLVIIPAEVEHSEAGPLALSPRLFCDIIAILLLILSVSLLLIGLRAKPEDEELADPEAKGHPLVRGGIAVAVSALYVVLITYMGYFSSTILVMIFFLRFFGAQSWKNGLLFLFVIIPFIYVLFVIALKVVVPEGLLV
jgi:hypothetical protein